MASDCENLYPSKKKLKIKTQKSFVRSGTENPGKIEKLFFSASLIIKFEFTFLFSLSSRWWKVQFVLNAYLVSLPNLITIRMLLNFGTSTADCFMASFVAENMRNCWSDMTVRL